MDTNEVKQILDREIQELIADFRQNPNVFLTEEDIRCHLFSRILGNELFSELQATATEGSRSIPIHSEVRWYGRNGKLKYRSDLVILETSDLQTRNSLELPSKGYGFNTFHAVVEIKLRRVRGDTNNVYARKIREDQEKTLELMREVDNLNAQHYLLCFDKKSDISTLLPALEGTPRLTRSYVFQP
ncbi:MAG: hypothetical protein WBK28_00255 [Minisyncoccia bacterium]